MRRLGATSPGNAALSKMKASTTEIFWEKKLKEKNQRQNANESKFSPQGIERVGGGAEQETTGEEWFAGGEKSSGVQGMNSGGGKVETWSDLNSRRPLKNSHKWPGSDVNTYARYSTAKLR